MPRKASQPSVSDLDAADGGVAAVDRALSLLAAFQAGDGTLSLAQLAERTGLYKSTVLRLVASLEHARFIARRSDGSYALGPALARLHGLYTASFSLEAEVLPVLQQLVADTQESAAYHVRQGEQRLCLFRVDSLQLLRDHIRVGDVLPMDRGAGGRVLTAFAGARGKLYESIRASGIATVDGDRVAGLTGISSPVFDAQGQVVGALTLTMPSIRMQKRFPALVRKAAAGLTTRLGGETPAFKG